MDRELSIQRAKPFRYELMWESHDDLKPFVATSWSKTARATSVAQMKEKLDDLSGDLASWDKMTFGNVRTEIQRLKRELEVLRSTPGRDGASPREWVIVDRLVELYHREEVLWKQISRVEWLASGDKNSRFFHLRATMRRRKNLIKSLHNADGDIINSIDQLETMATQFYKELYTSEGVSNMNAVLDCVPTKVSAEMNAVLEADFSADEVKRALFQIFPLKAPDPDGFPAHFFQKHWDICGDEVVKAVLLIVRGEESLESINKTCLVLIPKVKNPTHLSQFRPISLCNVLYKIALKVLANRLKIILPDIVFLEQSTFVPGRLITDNVIVAYECLQFMKRNKSQRHRHCALKLDMMKA